MLLAIDVGNTSVTVGAFEGETLRAKWRLATDARKLPDEYGTLFLSLAEHHGIPAGGFSGAAICSVVPELEATFVEVCERFFSVKPLLVEAGVRTGLRILYDSPRDVGADRVVDAVAAIHLYGKPLVIVDLGTATVFDAINNEGDYLGGAIAPGLAIAAEALFSRAAKLYRVELVRPPEAIGRNTVLALQAGVVFGYVGLVEGLVARFQKELGGEAKVVATGGYADLVAAETSVIDYVNPDLTLIGLRLIYDMNQG